MSTIVLSGLSILLATWIPAPFVLAGHYGHRRAGWAGVALAVITYSAATAANLIWHEWVMAIACAVAVAVILEALWRRHCRRGRVPYICAARSRKSARPPLP